MENKIFITAIFREVLNDRILILNIIFYMTKDCISEVIKYLTTKTKTDYYLYHKQSKNNHDKKRTTRHKRIYVSPKIQKYNFLNNERITS